ncbi:hypothetical protein HY991_05745 [Candidatus Micrarchaeota archaeon]|nr:hypothetical protein [Candidatus Micrarchaeota archaeon]
MLKIAFDTNCINALGKDKTLTKIEAFEKEGKVKLLFPSDMVLDLSKAKGPRGEQQKTKFEQREHVVGWLIVGLSRLPAKLGRDSSYELAKIIFGKEFRSLDYNSKVDVKMISSCKSSADYFVTREKRYLRVSGEIAKVISVSVVSPEEILSILEEVKSG